MAATATRTPATPEQQARIAELYDSRAVPEEKKRGTETFSKVGATRWTNLLESYPLREEQGGNSNGTRKPHGRKRAPVETRQVAPQKLERAKFANGAAGLAAYRKAMGAYLQAMKKAKAGTNQMSAKQFAAKAKGTDHKPAKVAQPREVDMALAKRVVTERDRNGLSWLRIGAKFKLSPDGATAKAGAARARVLYRAVPLHCPRPGRTR
jgi:hypothetical protein